jgi:hypothetical protein
MWRPLAIAVGVLTLSALSGVGAYQLVRPAIERDSAGENSSNPKWQEIAWTFPRDGWPAGRAFRCASCGEGGAGVELYVRPKIGFCNCATGVSDEAELERVADTELLRAKTRALGSGRPIKVGWMRGLTRSYSASDGETGERLVSIAYNDECDVVVAVARFANGNPAVLEPAILAFLNTDTMVLWAKKELGLEFFRREW